MIKSVYNLCKDSLPNWTARVDVRQPATCEMILKMISYQAGSETWRYLLGGKTISNLQQVRSDHSSNCRDFREIRKGIDIHISGACEHYASG